MALSLQVRWPQRRRPLVGSLEGKLHAAPLETSKSNYLRYDLIERAMLKFLSHADRKATLMPHRRVDFGIERHREA